MSARRTFTAAAALLLAACSEEAPPPPGPVSPPVESFESIPDGPVSGTLRGTAFTVRDARYIVDRRMGYAHTDILLSMGSADAHCGPIKQKDASKVWLRLAGAKAVERGQMKLDPAKPESWSVHYQVREGGQWVGNGDGAALVSIRSAGLDGRIAGDLAVCFRDGRKSCVKGTFDARFCPVSIDEPVRGTLPVEDVEGKLPKHKPAPAGDAGAPAAVNAGDAGAADAAPHPH